MKVLGLIPARGGSKRVPKKNIRLLNGKPLITYTIEAAQKSIKLDRIIVTTDSLEIANICKKAGAEVPFIRPAEFAKGNTPDKPVLIHAIKWLKENENYYPDIIVILRPTTPFKTPEIIDKVITMLKQTGADSVRTMTKVEGVLHPYWMYKKYDSNRAIPFCSEISIDEYYQSQLLPIVFRINGVVDAIKTDVILNHIFLYGEDMRFFEISEGFSIDIDTEIDLQLCEIIMNDFK